MLSSIETKEALKERSPALKALSVAMAGQPLAPWSEDYARVKCVPCAAHAYARFVMKARWPDGEQAIVFDNVWATEYVRHVIKGPWPEFETRLAYSGRCEEIVWYAIASGKRVPHLESKVVGCTDCEERYLSIFPDSKDDWITSGLADWLD